ncbi:MAG: DUF58 domain-containing protein [Pseudomonadota bacterium]
MPASEVMALQGLTLRARCVADGVLAGLHHSRRLGESAEFAEHKLYAPGDDVRRIDWKAFAKTDRYFVKRFEEETSLRAFLVVDSSGSMTYPEQGRPTKFEYSATLAASLSLLLLRQSDAVGLLNFGRDCQLIVPPGAARDQAHALTRALEAIQPGGGTDAQRAFAQLGDQVRRHSLVVVLSDLLGVVDEAGDLDLVLGGLAALRARGADVAVLQVMDRDELELPFAGVVRFKDLEGDREIQVDADAIRETYKEEVQAYLARIERTAHAAGLTYQRVRTDDAPASVLARFIADRDGAR